MGKKPPARGVVREVRDALRLTQDEIAALAGVSRRSLTRWETGDARPAFTQAARLVKAVLQRDRALAEKLAAALDLPPLPPPPLPPREFDLLLYVAADDLVVPAVRLRATVAQLLARWGAHGLTLEDAHARLVEKRAPPKRRA